MAHKMFIYVGIILLLLLLKTTPGICQPDIGYIVRQQQAQLQAQYDTQTRRLDEANTRNFRYLNNRTAPYRVKSLPSLSNNVGELYSGLIPIDNNDTSRQLFFVFQPTIGAPVNDITIWLNGGPGCSSLIGFLQENGRFLWQPGSNPAENPYTWTNLTNVLWVEQPVGTGFSIGKVRARDEVDVANEFNGFFRNFEILFGIENYKIYVTGESYAGRYVPYISAGMLDQNDSKYFDLHGAMVYDPCIGSYPWVSFMMASVPFVTHNNVILNLNASFLAHAQSLHESCGYAAFNEKYLSFPPPDVQPRRPNFNSKPPPGVPEFSHRCDLFGLTRAALTEVNPCFDIYEITASCPVLENVLSNPGRGMQTYFNRNDVKAALHAPTTAQWQECSAGPVFKGYNDRSLDPIQHVLPQIIDATNRVLVANGDFDYLLTTNGTLLSIQNMTWGGKLGFQQQPVTPIVIDIADLEYGYGPQGVMGIQHYERGLMWAETYQGGHQGPEWQPRVAYRHLQWLLGYTETL